MTTEPQIVRSTWANVYPHGRGYEHRSRFNADFAASQNRAYRTAVERVDYFEDGTRKVKLEDV